MSDSCNRALNQLVAILSRSLPAYLVDAAPWSNGKDKLGMPLLESIVADQQAVVDKIAELLMDRGMAVNQGAFPMQFTDLHDLSLDYLLALAVRHQRADLDKIKQLAPDVADDPPSRELLEEALGTATGHLEALQDHLRQAAA